MVGEEGQDVDELDTGDGEVGELAERGFEAYLLTGEFGGAGGMGGGLGLRSRGGGMVCGGGC